MNNEIYILGVGHNSVVCMELAEDCGYTVKGFYHYDDTRTGEIIYGVTILGSTQELLSKESLSGTNFILSMGSNSIRVEIGEKILEKGGNLPTLIHPQAFVSRFSKLGKGVIIHAGCVVDAGSELGDLCILSYQAMVTHNCVVGKGCFLSTTAQIGAYTNVEDQVFVGQGAISISQKVKNIGSNSYIGAGAVITKPVEKYATVAGVPAKEIKVPTVTL